MRERNRGLFSKNSSGLGELGLLVGVFMVHAECDWSMMLELGTGHCRVAGPPPAIRPILTWKASTDYVQRSF